MRLTPTGQQSIADTLTLGWRKKVSQYAGGDEKVGEALRGVADCKQSYEIGSEDNAEHPNVWLPEDTLPGFKTSMFEFYWKCDIVAKSILEAMALGIRLDDTEHLAKYHSGQNNQL